MWLVQHWQGVSTYSKSPAAISKITWVVTCYSIASTKRIIWWLLYHWLSIGCTKSNALQHPCPTLRCKKGRAKWIGRVILQGRTCFGKDDLWNDKYDYLFWMRLKELWNYNQGSTDKAQQELAKSSLHHLAMWNPPLEAKSTMEFAEAKHSWMKTCSEKIGCVSCSVLN